MKFYGEQIFLKMYEDPDFPLGFHRWITEVSIVLVRHYAELAEMPITSVHVGECSGTMVKAKHYEKFIIPYLNMLAEALGPIRLHSCGNSDHLLSSFGQIEQLQVLDTGSNTSVAAVREHLGGDLQLDLAPPLSVLSKNAEPAAMLDWVDQALTENQDGPLLIGYHLEPGYSLENCLLVHDDLARRGLITKGRQRSGNG
jgi:hypothetical protein